jgi:hypothetical protein
MNESVHVAFYSYGVLKYCLHMHEAEVFFFFENNEAEVQL